MKYDCKKIKIYPHWFYRVLIAKINGHRAFLQNKNVISTYYNAFPKKYVSSIDRACQQTQEN